MQAESRAQCIPANHPNIGGLGNRGETAIVRSGDQKIASQIIDSAQRRIRPAVELCQRPDPTAAVQPADRLDLSMTRFAILLEEIRDLLILHDLIAIGSDLKHLIRVRPHNGPELLQRISQQA